jgi:sulfite reductase (NADPH) flavoprotein alpha-component
MLNKDKQHTVTGLLRTLTREELIWTDGYIQGVLSHMDGSLFLSPQENGGGQAQPRLLTLVYGTETGNTKLVAQHLEKAAKGAGIKVKNLSFSKFSVDDLKKISHPVILLTSTHGEGEPPITAKAFFESMKSQKSVDLKGKSYAVLGLGDKSYQQFCQAAVEVDAFLTASGARAFHPLTLLDVDYAKHTSAWIQDVLKAYESVQKGFESSSKAAHALYEEDVVDPSRGYSRLEPVTATVIANINLNDRGSSKRTHHLELRLNEPVSYAVGDALGVLLPVGADGVQPAPRLYSIASAQSVVGDEAHILVSLAWHLLPDGTKSYGVASDYLVNLAEGSEIQVYIHRNRQFRLPADDKDIIMIGAGTGVAPFRGFVQERQEQGASGRNWLIFGEQHAHCDFFYQAEWQDLVANETLTYIDLAFSRDQKEKIYVQHRLIEKGQEVMNWINAGAVIYICGRKDPMSFDVDKALIQLLKIYNGLSEEQAQAQLMDWIDEGQYLKDVY